MSRGLQPWAFAVVFALAFLSVIPEGNPLLLLHASVENRWYWVSLKFGNFDNR